MSEIKLSERMEYVESLFEKYGAAPLDINEKNRAKHGERAIFKRFDMYYRTGCMAFEDTGELFLVISCTDEEMYAGVGVMEDVAAFRPDESDEKIEKEVRYALGIEPYPEDYQSG